ncbi:uncharacterized protein LOC129947175 [Eupeodes corollae]|uniref:uncharacterized protein LOC129947175 n=1 Tax=Eupeodes corollae TaxID=290404 RepID=UPI002490250B|nr:uncharacterized protein LOC129947175 [Eupeodes corollae]
MDHNFVVTILFLLIFGQLGAINGYAAYKWQPFKSGDKIPYNAAKIEAQEHIYVGRARHFDEMLPAEINANGSATVFSCQKVIPKYVLEILLISEECDWKEFDNFYDIDETAVRAGTVDGEPIYIGSGTLEKAYYEISVRHIASIMLNSQQVHCWKNNNNCYLLQYLSCNTKTKWVDSSAVNLPNNSISGGKSEKGHDIYVAQLKKGCNIFAGQVIPLMGIATAIQHNEETIVAKYCQVLVGEPNEYRWVSASNRQIPDYAVSNGKYGNELGYLARINMTLTYVTSTMIHGMEADYEFLVENDDLFKIN